jgi:hypothetical protein
MIGNPLTCPAFPGALLRTLVAIDRDWLGAKGEL